MDRLGKLLVFTGKAARQRLERMLARDGTSMSHFVLLSSLHAAPDVSQRELADVMGIVGPTLTHHLDRFEHEGLISRARDPEDRRVVRVRLTTKGEGQHDLVSAIADEHDAALQQMLGPRDAAALRRILTRLRNRLAEESHA